VSCIEFGYILIQS